jgi:hypothetical protein
MFPTLKSYFLSQEKCPIMLRKISNDPVALVWIYSLGIQMKVCSNSMKKVQSNSISGRYTFTWPGTLKIMGNFPDAATKKLMK